MRISILCIALFALVFLTFSATSNLGQACNATSECKVGYCESGKCFLPQLSSYDAVATCTSTQDCNQGYCDTKGQCIVPKTPTSTTLTLLPTIKSGCSGLMEETKEFGSFAICSLFWILVPIISIAAGLASRNEKLKLIPVIAFFVPMLVTLFITPYLGLIVATAELVFLASRRFERRK